MKYNGFYFWMFKRSMRKVLAEKYDKQYAAEIMKKSKKVYRELVAKADDIGDDNPMAYNELFALAFVAPYVASGKRIPPETVQEMMRCSLYDIKWYFGRTDLNTEKGKAENTAIITLRATGSNPDCPILISIFFRHGRDKVFDCIAQLGVADNKVNCRSLALGHHYPLSLMDEDLQIAESMSGTLLHAIIRVLFGEDPGLFQMSLIFLLVVCNVGLAEHAGKLKHRLVSQKFLRCDHWYLIFNSFGL